SGNEDWYLTDRLGSVRDIANSSGSAIDHIDYTSFGQIYAESSPSNGDRYKFSGREWESEWDAQYNRARVLKNGRWMSEDPIRLRAGDPNYYRYVFNSPSNATDPSGELFFLIVVVAVLGGASGGAVEGVRQGIERGENPVVRGFQGALMGAGVGGLLGITVATGGKVAVWAGIRIRIALVGAGAGAALPRTREVIERQLRTLQQELQRIRDALERRAHRPFLEWRDMQDRLADLEKQIDDLLQELLPLLPR
ncbi:MAG: hypothetical protein L0215_02355, partial [Gemmataceae bacterium]|nr:hypothetical protein [Gemmataceae bacterium]